MTLPSVWPASQSRPSTPYGATETAPWQRMTRSGEERGAGEGMRSTARPAGHDEAVDPEHLRDPLDIGDDVGDPASGQPRRLSIPRAVEADPPQPVAPIDRRIGPPADAPARRPVEGEERKAVRVAPLGHGQRTAVGRLDPVLDVLGDDVRVGKHGIDLLSRWPPPESRSGA